MLVNNPTFRQLNAKSQCGVSLIEVLVAALILGVGLLGVLTQQSRAVQFNQQAYFYSQANILMQDIAERMRANPEVADAYRTEFGAAAGTATACTSAAAPCTAAQMAAWDLNEWRTSVSDLLPSGDAQIRATAGSSTGHTISVRFDSSAEFSDSVVTETLQMTIEL